MRNQLHLFQRIYAIALCAVAYGCISPLLAQAEMTIEQAKERLKNFQVEYKSSDEVFRQRIEREVSVQIDTTPKSEFETTKEFENRLLTAKALREQLESKYSAEKTAHKLRLQHNISILQGINFHVPVEVVFGLYDADKEELPITVISAGRKYVEVLLLSRTSAKALKVSPSKAEVDGLFRIAIKDHEAVDYFVGVKVKFDGSDYQSWRPESETERVVEQLLLDEDIIDLIGEKYSDDLVWTRKRLVNEINIARHDLNIDGIPEYVLSATFKMGLCGSGGCSHWVYQRTDTGFRRLLRGEDVVSNVLLAKKRTNGYFDLVLSTNHGAYSAWVHTYKFNGREYVSTECFVRSFITDRGKVTKSPRITPCEE